MEDQAGGDDAAAGKPSPAAERKRRLKIRIRRYNAGPLLAQLHMILKGIEGRFLRGNGGAIERFWLPWEILYLIETTIAYGRLDSSFPRASRRDIVKMMQYVKRISPGVPPPAEMHRAAKITRIAAHQQFWWQDQLLRDQFARLALIFSGSPAGRVCSAMVSKTWGIDVERFVVLAAACWLSWAIHDKAEGSLRHLPAFKFGGREIEGFLQFAGATMPEAREMIRERRAKLPSAEWELLVGSPLRSRPLLLLAEQVMPLSKAVFGSFIEFGVYDRMKSSQGQHFCNEFGHAFEEYVHNALSWSGASFEVEAEILARLGQGKTVDFLLTYPGALIAVETKGVELSPNVAASGERELLVKCLASSAVKAVVQTYATFARQERHDPSDRRTRFSLVVTYKDLYLGNGRAVWDEFLGDCVSTQLPELDCQALMPPSHIFFVSLRELDFLLAEEQVHPGFLPGFLAWAAEENVRLETRRFTVRQHLQAKGVKLENPEYLEAKWTKIESAVTLTQPPSTEG